MLIVLNLLCFNTTNAQCGSCTTNITGLDNNNYFISSGVTICVAPTGTMTGLITVNSGGTLCNQGKIQSTNLWVNGGTLNNYGTINTNSVLVSSGGFYQNDGTFQADSFLVTNSSSHYINNLYHTTTAFTTSDHALTENFGNSMYAYNLLDSAATFNNHTSITITNNMAVTGTATLTNDGGITVTNTLAVSYTSTCTNNNYIVCYKDFYNSYSSTFFNNAYMRIDQDFYNAYDAIFTTDCRIDVGRNWYNSNSAWILSPSLSTCGGFYINGGSYNLANIGSVSCHVDICDAGHPTFGLDGPGGNISNTTTFCSTSCNSCPVTSINEKVNSFNTFLLYPNPATNILTIKLNNREAETLSIEVRDMMGKTVLAKSLKVSIGENETELNVSNLVQGTYILNVIDSHQLHSKRLFNVTK